ncbi:MAG: RbsD/FucU domain-containing protein [Terracidiphilus sp.]|nr:RbsD/FucU domain-containing protein [Terracidiphilus sp.]
MTDSKMSATPEWKRRLSTLLPLYGHRNWVVIADAAYPTQSKPGIETIVADADQMEVVRLVLDAITASRHIRPNVYADKELGFVAEKDAPGVMEYRRQLDELLYNSSVTYLPHDQIIARLDKAAQVFHILVIKTEMTIPYTSVFFELDCGYWNAEAEQRLRQAMLVSDSR